MKLNLKLMSILLGTCILAGPTAGAMELRRDYCARSALVTHSDKTRIEESFRALPDFARSTLPCRERDRYADVGTVCQVPRKPEHQSVLRDEYCLRSGAKINATKVLKIPRSETRGKVSAIATQCPHNSTALNDFFELILTSKINCLVVIGEISRDRSCDYWNPNAVARELRVDERTMIASSIKYYNVISSRINRQGPGYTVYDLEIGEFLCGVRTTTPSKTITLYHYQQWPVYGTPTNVDNFYNFVDHIASLSNGGSNLKVLVHCSAGTGRTGTFLACLKFAIEQPTIILSEIVEYAENVVKYLREHRSGMVKTPEQYEILYKFIHQKLQRLH